jgi:site-specific recombinase XerD
LKALLESIPRSVNSDYEFPAKSGKPFKNIYQAWNTARTKAGLRNVRMHDLRHTFASTLVNAGVPLHNIQLLLGQHNISVTQRYAHLSKDSLMSFAEIAGSLLSAVLTLPSANGDSGADSAP